MIGEESDHKMNSGQVLIHSLDFAKSFLQGRAFAVTEVPGFLKEVHATVSALNDAKADPVATASTEKPKPAVSVKNSVHDDHLVCLHDGKSFKSLKRHLKSVYNQTPEDYREMFGLPSTYPMTAPAYARQRSELAKNSGLGQLRRKAA